MKYTIFIFLIIFFIIIIPYVYKILPLKTLTSVDLPQEGSWTNLSKGNIYYRWYLPEQNNQHNEVIILVHGFSTPSWVWNGVLKDFLDSGYKVLVYDHYGRGFSERPNTRYTKELYVNSLKELIDDQSINEPFHLVGYSMGAPIVGFYGDAHPESIASISLIAPAGLMRQESRLNKWLLLPYLGEWIWHVFGDKIYGSSETDFSLDPKSINKEEFSDKFKQQLRFKGFTEALLSTVRNFNLFDTEYMYSNLGKKNVPVLVIWGTKDGVVPYKSSKKLLEIMPNINLVTIQEGTHDITYRQPSKVAKEILLFIDLNLQN